MLYKTMSAKVMRKSEQRKLFKLNKFNEIISRLP